MKILNKLLIAMLIVIFTVALGKNNSFAEGQSTKANDIITFMESGNSAVKAGSVNEKAAGQLSKIIGGLLGFLRLASGLVAILMIAITGFNYIIGGAEVKEEMKKKMFPIILGLLLVFGAASIAIFVMGVITGTDG